MQDDSPWRPPRDDGQPTGGPVLPPAEPSIPAPILPAAPAVQPASDTPSVTAPEPPQPVVTAPPGMDGPAAPTDWMPTSSPGVDAAESADVIVRSSDPEVRPRRSKWLVGGAAAAVVATGVAGVFAVSNLTGTPQGGAASPDELGLSLLQAIENEDVLGVVDVLSPGERDVFRDPLVDLVSELTRLEILSSDADLSRILGVEIDFSNEVVTSTSTNVPDITNIDLRADAVVTFDGAQLPIGALVTDNLDDDTLTEMRGTRSTETDELDVRLTAVEEDGRWYFSVFHTIAELARDELAPGSLIPVQGIGADGADAPDAAFDAVLDRVEALDLTGLLRTLNPGEAAALQRYAPLFLEDAEAELDDAPLEWEITRREFRVDESGDEATVFLDAIGIDGSIEDESFSLKFADGCLNAEAAGESLEQCTGSAFEDATGAFDDLPEVERLIETVTAAFADMEEVGLELHRSDGLWYVSPVATATESVLAVLRSLDRSELDAIIEQVPAAGEEIGDAIFGGLNDLPGAFDDAFDDGFDDTTDATPPVANPDVAPGATGSWEDCYEEVEAAAATACFQAAVDRGEIDVSFIPLALRHPQCGYEISWGGDFYSLPDDEFIAAAEAARPCFLDLVERGEVSEFELPTEILHLECFEGRNWYHVFDDPEYDGRYYACIDAAFGA